MKRNMFWTAWGVASFVCLFIAGYKSFANEVKNYNKMFCKKVCAARPINDAMPVIKVFKISAGDREKLAMISVDREVLTICEGMNIAESYKVAQIEPDHIVVCSVKEPSITSTHFVKQ